jgi:hypothetical protein
MEPTAEDAHAFIAALPDDARRTDAETLSGLMADWTGEPAVMWGSSIVGFGRYDYRYDSGHAGSAPLVGFAARKTNLVLYLAAGLDQRDADLLGRLGPHKTGKGCLYLKRLDDVDAEALRALVERTLQVHRQAGGG